MNIEIVRCSNKKKRLKMLTTEFVSRKKGIGYWEKEDYYFGSASNFEIISGREYWNIESDKMDFRNFERIVDIRLNANNRKARKNDRLAYDLTFSAPKSVSLLAAYSDDKDKIFDVHRKAISRTMEYLKDNGYFGTPEGKSRELAEINKDSILAVRVDHFTSREMDPQLHSHVLVANAVEREGKLKSINISELLYKQKLAGYLYKQELAKGLQELGYSVEWDNKKGGFEVKGFSDDIIKEFSKRRQQILEKIKELDIDYDVKKAQIACLDTRNYKKNITKEDLIEYWNLKKEVTGFDIDKIKEISQQQLNKEQQIENKIEKEIKAKAIVKEAIKDAFLLDGIVRKDLLTMKIGQKLSDNNITLGIDEIQGLVDNELNKYIENKGKVQLYKDMLNREYFTDMKIYSAFSKNELINIRDGQFSIDKNEAKRMLFLYNRQLEKDKGFKLDYKQLNLIRDVATSERDFVILGKAGAGKSTMMAFLNRLYKDKKVGIAGVSLSGSAAFNLEKESGIKSYTVDALGYKINELKKQNVKLLVVDEAGMLDEKRSLSIKEIANKLNAKILWVGDTEQLKPVSIGDPFSKLVTEAREKGSFGMLSEIYRQKNSFYKDLVVDSAFGNNKEAFEKLNKLGWVKYSKNNKEKLEKLLSDYNRNITLMGKDIKDMLIVTHSVSDVNKINDNVRNLLISNGILDNSNSVNIEIKNSKKQKMKKEFTTGDRIIFLKNQKDIKNGMLGTITNIDVENKKMTVAIDDYKEVTIDYSKYKYFDYSYAITTHKSQGLTKDTVFVYSSNSFNSNLFYVAISRGRERCNIYVNEKDKDIFIDRIQQKERKLDILSLVQDRENKEFDKDYIATEDIKEDLKEKSVTDYILYDDGSKEITTQILNNGTIDIDEVSKEASEFQHSYNNNLHPQIISELQQDLQNKFVELNNELNFTNELTFKNHILQKDDNIHKHIKKHRDLDFELEL